MEMRGQAIYTSDSSSSSADPSSEDEQGRKKIDQAIALEQQRGNSWSFWKLIFEEMTPLKPRLFRG